MLSKYSPRSRQMPGGDDHRLGAGSPGARRVADRPPTPHPLANPLEDRHRPDSRTAVTTEPGLHGIDADDGNRPGGAGKRQHTALIPEQHHRVAGRFARERPMSGSAVPVLGAVRARVRLLEQSELEFGAKHPRHRGIDH